MFTENALLSGYSHYKIGGPARYFFETKNIEKIIEAVSQARKMRLPIFILGGGTNILFADDEFDGLVLKPNVQFIEKEGDFVRVGAGTLMSEITDYFLEKELSGLEWAAGLPGTLGGAIRGNAGCFGGEIKNLIHEVSSVDISGKKPEFKKRKFADCEFGYRSNVFKKNNGCEIILEAVLISKKGDKKAMENIARKNFDYRQEKQPLEYPSIGSVFKNIPLENIKTIDENMKKAVKNDPFPIMPAAYLISEAGLKGISHGGAMISPKHPNFIVNVLKATSNDVKNLIQLVKKEVKKKFGIALEEEIVRL